MAKPLNVTKVLVGIAQEKIGTKEEILAGEDTDKIISVAYLRDHRGERRR